MFRSVLALAMALLLSACGGVASIDLFFVANPPRDGTNLVLVVMEGVGSSAQVLETHIERFDGGFRGAEVRVPFGGQRSIVATLETDELQPRVLFSGRSGAFRLEDSDRPTLFIDMFPVPQPGMVRVAGSGSGRVSTATVSLVIGGRDAVGVSISEDPTFPRGRTEDFRIADLTPTRNDVFAPQFEVSASFQIDGSCTERFGCTRTIYLRFFDANVFQSDVFSTTLVYDPFPPRLLEASVTIDSGAAVLGSGGRALILTEFDEPVALSMFARLSGGSSACPRLLDVLDGSLSGAALPLDCAGTYSLEVTATDLAGNTVRFVDAATIVVDRIPPPPLFRAALRSSCVGDQEVVTGDPGAAEPNAIVQAAGVRARADAQGAFVVAAPGPGMVELFQQDAAGNAGGRISFEVSPCGT